MIPIIVTWCEVRDSKCEQWPDFGCEGIKVQRAHQPTSQCQGKKKFFQLCVLSFYGFAFFFFLSWFWFTGIVCQMDKQVILQSVAIISIFTPISLQSTRAFNKFFGKKIS
eukprot:TRINITY_DN5652_c0_g1_i5.p1 TRINITY_DN5652_c0_g1~~TRINITY_DN5652_c0_g1_i5.p1  ORF type:complete len:110 (+),score=11.67 TRINITY_DN5652_c0_g1_i5:138-467(+)